MRALHHWASRVYAAWMLGVVDSQTASASRRALGCMPMGFSGSYVVAATDGPLAESEWIRDLGLTELGRAEDGRWHLLKVDDFVKPTKSVSAVLGCPVLAADVVDSDFAVLTARLPDGRGWRWVLSPEMARGYGAPETEIGDPDESAAEVMTWAETGGLEPDRDAVREHLARESDPFAEDLVLHFFRALGLHFRESQ